MTLKTPAAIIVAHPGHEVRIHGWLERERPQVFVLTDGAGRAGEPRINATKEYLRKFNVPAGRIFGAFTDLEVYRLLLARDHEPFVRLSEELADALITSEVERVAGDASEGYNTAHDVARLLTNVAVELAGRSTGRAIRNYDFPIVNRPDHCPSHLRAGALWLHLDDASFERKLDTAFEFYPELAAETKDALEGGGQDAVVKYFNLNDDPHAATDLSGLEMFRVECLRPASPDDPPFASDRAFYERQGQDRVHAGFYDQVIRYHEHMRPLADALWENVERNV
jgi:hypothetical protein